MTAKGKWFPLLCLMATAAFASATVSARLRNGSNTSESDLPSRPYFSFTRSQWESTLTELPASIRNAIHSDEALFFRETAVFLDEGHSFYSHIDTHTPVTEKEAAPDDLVDLNDCSVLISKPIRLRRPAAEALEALSRAAAADGIRLIGISGYRTYAYQQQLYEKLKHDVGKAGKAVSAAPGHSQHQTGLAIDLNSLKQDFGETKEGLWLKANAGRYGWSLSYPEHFEDLTGYDYEPWHYRYITPAGCRLQQRFFSGIQFYLTSYYHNYDSFYREFRIHE